MTDLIDMGDTKSRISPDNGGTGQDLGQSASASQIRPRGPVLFGKYELLTRLRTGGMAELFRARDLAAPERLLAIKRILPSFTDEADYMAMFLDEARLGLRLKHPGIVEAIELGQVDDALYIALEYVHGQDVGALLGRSREHKQPLPFAVACRIALDVCGALHYAHELSDEQGAPLGVVHRDVSPQNVLVSYDGAVKLLDFGIAKSSEQLMRTQAGLLKGKHGYLSPEQARGQSVDRRSDLFSLGICLFEMLSAQRLFQGSSDFSTIVKVRNAEVPDLRRLRPNVPEELAAIVHRALAREPSDRFQTAAEMGAAIQHFGDKSGELGSVAMVAAYMRETFADALAGKTIEPAADAQRDPGTGLLDAFDDVEPPSAVSTLAALEPEATVHPLQANADAEAIEVAAEQLQEIHEVKAEDVTAVGEDVTEVDGPGEGAAAIPAEVTRRAEAPRATDEESAFATLEMPSIKPDTPTRVVEYESTVDGEVSADDINEDTQPGLRHKRRRSHPHEREDATDASARAGDDEPASDEPDEPTLSRTAPLAAFGTTLPGVGMGMDWDDDDLSTHVYDGPDSSGKPLPAPPKVPSSPGFVPGRPMSLPSPPQPAGVAVVPPGAPSPFTSVRPVSDTPVGRHPRVQARTRPAPAASADMGVPPSLVAAVAAALVIVGGAVFWLMREPTRGSLHLTTDPIDTTVTLDGISVGSSGSPFVLTEVAPDVTHELEVKKAGYRSWRSALSLHPGQVVDLPQVTLVPEAKPVQPRVAPPPVAAQSVPAPAPVAIAQAPQPQAAPVQVAPAPTPQPSYTGHPTIARGAHRTGRATHPVAEPPREAMSSPATPSVGGTAMLRINSRPWSRVLVDGRLLGNTPQMSIVLSAGRHTVTLMNPDFGLQKVLTVQLKPGESLTKIVDLAN